MQEVVKRLQEKQERKKEIKMPDRVTLVIAKWGGKNYPVILPKPMCIQPGDLVWFRPESAAVCGDVLYVDDYCDPDGAIWTLATVTTGREPIKAIRIAQTSELKWEEESK